MEVTLAQLIAADALARALEGPNPPVVLDVRFRLAGPPAGQPGSARYDYEQAHLPGAHFVDVDTELADAPGDRGRHPLPEPGALQRTLRRAGINQDTPVVAYDDADGSAAARAWWLLRWAAHDDVAVLDGGYAAWVNAGYPVTAEIPADGAGQFVVRGGAMPVVDADEAAVLARDGVLLDARAPQRYAGEHEPIDARAGHIPGAVNAPFTGHVDQGRWRAPAELAERFAAMGVSEDAPVGAYCGSGVTASSVILALEHAGISGPGHRAALYPGSWSEWSRDPARPAATGPEPG